MNKAIRVGVLTEADGAHLNEYFSSLVQVAEVGQVAVADSSGQSAKAARERLGDRLTQVYDDPATLLREFKPELALVTMEPRHAPPVIRAALEAGCHVLAEKPACVSARDFESLVKLAESKHRHLMLALANRPHAPVQEARRLVQAGKLGKLYGLSMFLIADQARLTQPSYQKVWRAFKSRAGGGYLIWLGIHWLDLATYITGLKVEQVTGFATNVGGQPYDVEDSASVSLRYNDNVLGSMLAGYYLDQKHKTKIAGYHSHLQIWGERGWIRLALIEDEPLLWYSSAEDGEPTVRKFEYPAKQRSYLPFVRECVRTAAGLQEAPISGREGLQVLQTIFALYRAAESGQTQKIG